MKNFPSRSAAANARPQPQNFRFLSRATRIFVSCLSATLLFFIAASVSARAQAVPRNDSERELFELLNRERIANNLPQLRWDAALFKAARGHALRMLDLNSLEHQLPGEPAIAARLTTAGARFSYFAENLASGKDPRAIHEGWMDSPGHRRNILDPRATSVGIAVVRGNGGLFAVEDFSHAVSNLSLEQQEKQVGALLRAQGLNVSGASEDARKACDGNAGLPGLQSWTVVHVETADLSAFPPELEKKIRKEPYHNVAVGACRPKDEAEYKIYRIALIFF